MPKLSTAVFICVTLLLTAFLITTASTTATDEKMVDVGGYRLNCRILGEGEPTVVFLSGSGATQDYWSEVATIISQKTRVVTYDRAGYGKSEMGGEPKTSLRIAEELQVLLKKLEVPGPYLLVAHSFGCKVAIQYSFKFNNDVCGVILLDPTHPKFIEDFEASILPAERQMFEDMRARMFNGPLPSGGVGAEIKESWMDIQELMKITELPDIPFIIMTSPYKSRLTPLHKRLSDNSIQLFLDMSKEYHEKLAAMSSQGVHIQVENTGHNIHLDQPEIVIAKIVQLLTDLSARD